MENSKSGVFLKDSVQPELQELDKFLEGCRKDNRKSKKLMSSLAQFLPAEERVILQAANED